MECLDIKIKKYYAEWLMHCQGLTKNKHDAEDLLHKILIGVLESGKGRQLACECERDELKVYVNRAIWLDFYKTKSRSVIKINIDDIAELSSENTEYNVPGEHYDVLLKWLNEYDRELLKMYTTKGFTMQEASVVLGISRQKLSRDIKDASKKLYKYVQDSRSTDTD